MALALVLLAGVFGTLGFWYHDFLESHIPILQRPSDSPPQEMNLPQTMPDKSEIPKAPGQDSLDIHEPLLETIETVDRPKNGPQPLSMQKEPVIDPLAHPTPISSKPSQKPSEPSITQPPHASETHAPTKNQPDASLSPAPVQQQSSKTTPVVPKIAPRATTTAPQKELLKSPASPQPTKEAIPVKTESTQSATSIEEMNRGPSDKEIEKLLQSLDAPTADLSSITEPSSLRKP